MTTATFSTLDLLAALDFPAGCMPAGLLRETTVGWGEDTVCGVCLCHLPAGATAYEDRDSVLCNDCAAAEMER